MQLNLTAIFLFVLSTLMLIEARPSNPLLGDTVDQLREGLQRKKVDDRDSKTGDDATGTRQKRHMIYSYSQGYLSVNSFENTAADGCNWNGGSFTFVDEIDNTGSKDTCVGVPKPCNVNGTDMIRRKEEGTVSFMGELYYIPRNGYT
ncbi:hypothetical protein BDA99DRAFT_537532 [Phascolomyces articulosus]|uniref:Uncharacterized protein n=1 Tax=Phascolomyces articulosus TaxID=60185 RepID=A0AAD5JZH9_9FUNG|nr:hypothetical protein BDA99DRAFT_537532 [Phascolomyces articulosus]